MTDASGCQWTFVDKAPIFSAEELSDETPYPIPVVIDCEIIGPNVDDDQNLVRISTAQPWGIEATGGQTEFVVRRDQLVD
jgi:hypothetical protein